MKPKRKPPPQKAKPKATDPALKTATKGLTIDMVIQALKLSGGIRRKAADILGVSPANITYWCNRHPQLQKLRDDLRSVIDDAASDHIASVIVDDEADEFRRDELSKWWLSHRPESGFRKPSPQTNIGITNNSITIRLDPELQRRKDERKQELYQARLEESKRIGYEEPDEYDEGFDDE